MQNPTSLLQPKIARRHETSILCERETGGRLWVARQNFESSGKDYYVNNCDRHWFFIEQGTFELQTGGDRLLLHQHDYLCLPGSASYSMVKQGDESGCGIHGITKAVAEYYPSATQLQVMRKTERQCFEIGSSAVWVLTASPAPNQLWAGIIETPSLHDSPPATPQHKDKLFLVLAGRYEFQIGDARVQLETGDAAWLPQQTLHQFRVVSAALGQLLAVAV